MGTAWATWAQEAKRIAVATASALIMISAPPCMRFVFRLLFCLRDGV
jgi:hypothetical protein